MKKQQRLLVIGLCLIFSIMMCSCLGKLTSNSIVGKWNHSLGYGDIEWYEFFNDGTYSWGYYSTRFDTNYPKNGGKYSILDDGRLKLEIGYMVETKSMSKNGNKLIIDGYEYIKQ